MDNNRMLLKNCPISCFADEIDPRIDKQLALLEELGIRWIEMRSGDGKGVAEYTQQDAEALKKRLEERKIRVSAVGSPIGKIDITEAFEPHFETFCNIVRLAQIWETPYIRCFSFFIPEGADPAIFRDEVLRRIERMVELASKEKLTLLHENEKGIYGDNAARCLDLMQNFYGDAYKATFDFANYIQCGQDTIEAYEMLKDYIEYIHIKDALALSGQVVPAGEGDGHVRDILTLLDERGFKGFLSLEPHLADFAGLSQLEKEAAVRGRSDTEAAFVTAYQALCGILAQ